MNSHRYQATYEHPGSGVPPAQISASTEEEFRQLVARYATHVVESLIAGSDTSAKTSNAGRVKALNSVMMSILTNDETRPTDEMADLVFGAENWSADSSVTKSGAEAIEQSNRQWDAGCKLSQLRSLLYCSYGFGREWFEGAGADHRENLLWLASDLAEEIGDLSGRSEATQVAAVNEKYPLGQTKAMFREIAMMAEQVIEIHYNAPEPEGEAGERYEGLLRQCREVAERIGWAADLGATKLGADSVRGSAQDWLLSPSFDK